MKVVTSYNNFARGKIDHDMMGRYDLPIYQSGWDILENLFTNFKGNAIYRTGFEEMLGESFQDCVLQEFKFSNNQNYLMVMYNQKFRFLSYASDGSFGWVLDNGLNILEVTTPYTLDECRVLQFAQNADVMVITHNNHAPRRLKRDSSNSFTLSIQPITGNPFITLEAAKVITGITNAASAVVSVSAHGYAIGDRVQITNVVGMTQINDGAYLITAVTTNNFTISLNTTTFDAYISGGSAQKIRSISISNITQANPAVVTTSNSHQFSSGDTVTIYNVAGMTQVNGNNYVIDVVNSTQFRLRGINSTGFGAYTSGGLVRELDDYPSCCLFYRARLYYGATKYRTTTVWGSAAANYELFTIPGTVTDTSPLQFTIADISQRIEALFGGDNSLIATSADGIVAINGGGVGTAIKADTIEATLTSADGSNNSIPFKKDGLVFYIGRNNRNMYYFSYDLLTESFVAEDANFISYDITEGGIKKIRWKKDRNDLIYGVRGDGALLSLNFKQKENIIGWHTQRTNGSFKDIAVITDNDGNPQLFSLVLRNGAYYIERMADHVQFVERAGFFTYDGIESPRDAETRDTAAYNRVIAEQLRECVYLDNASTLQDLKSNTITFNPGTNTIISANPVFSIGDVGKHISYKTMTGYESGRFEIEGYTNSTTVTVSVLQAPTSNVYTDWYLSFRNLSGLSQYNGRTVGVVTDGGYLDDFLISGGTLDLGSQVLSVVVGYRYTAVAKGFCMGFQNGAANTQTTMKAISRVGVRCVSSAGGKIGSSLYHMEPVQQLSQNDINYLPPIPIDGTKYVTYVDNNTLDKYFYFVQDEPLPFTLASLIVETAYSI